MPFQCSYCNRAFNRQEHLNRHIRSRENLLYSLMDCLANFGKIDTANKPYVCSTCFRAFTRSDLLNRHEHSHSTVSQGSKKRDWEKEIGDGIVTIPRTKVACDSCAKAKVKCSGNVPCENCLKKGIACHVRHSKPSVINIDGQMASTYSNIALSQVTVGTHAQTGSDVCPSLPPSDIRTTSFFNLFDTSRVDDEVDNIFLGLFDGYDASVRDLRQALEFLGSFPEPYTTSVSQGCWEKYNTYPTRALVERLDADTMERSAPQTQTKQHQIRESPEIFRSRPLNPTPWSPQSPIFSRSGGAL